MKVFCFCRGPKAGQKSYRATWVANEAGMECIIDDGLLIRGNELYRATQPKRSRQRWFNPAGAVPRPEHAGAGARGDFTVSAGKYPDFGYIRIKWWQKLRKRLRIEPIVRTIRIEEVTTEEEIEKGKRIRRTQGKHVIPVPTFEIKKGFFGRTARHAAYF